MPSLAVRSPLAAFVDPLPIPQRLLAREHAGRFAVRIRPGLHRFHRNLPKSRIWGFDGSVPGPTIEAERGNPIRVEWINELEGTLPVAVTVAPTEADAEGVPVQCVPGLSGGVRDADAAALPGFSVVHLHGGLTAASYDGWAENFFAPGQNAVSDYTMDQRAALLYQRAALLWYHDHVMGVTRFTVYAGLAGLWIIRDERERDLGLPEGAPFELPLLLQDRNFGTDALGRLTGELVHKTDPGTMEAFGPFTTVNGKIWPLHEVQPSTYRLRVINGSNARTFRLVLTRGGHPDLARITQIGTDHGLLRTPVSVPAQGLVLAPAERADLLVDFSDLQPGTELTWLNTATAPFDGAPFPAKRATDAASLDGLLPYPDVLRFRVVPGARSRRPAPPELATDFVAPSSEQMAGAVHRAVALVEQELEGEANMLTMRELVRAGDGDSPEQLITILTPGQRRYRPGNRALPHGRVPLRGHRDLLPYPRAVRALAVHQPDGRHPPDAHPPQPFPGTRTASRHGYHPAGRHHGHRHGSHRPLRTEAGRSAHPCARPERTRSQRHHSGQPQRDRRAVAAAVCSGPAADVEKPANVATGDAVIVAPAGVGHGAADQLHRERAKGPGIRFSAGVAHDASWAPAGG